MQQVSSARVSVIEGEGEVDRFRFRGPGMILLMGLMLSGCATSVVHPSKIDRLPPGRVAALRIDPLKAERAARLTAQADREADQARELAAQQARDRELSRLHWQAWHHHPGYGYFGYRRPAGRIRWGLRFGF